MRVVLDANVIISALLSPNGAPAHVLREWVEGAYELIVSPRLLDELDRALAYPKLRSRVTESEAVDLIELLRGAAHVRDDPEAPPPVRSRDPDDDHLIALAAATSASLVSGDEHLLGLGGGFPVHSPAEFLSRLRSEP